MVDMIKEFGEKTGFPPEAIAFLEEKFCIMQQKEMMNPLYAAMDNFFFETDRGYFERLQEISKKTEIHRMTVDMIFLILCAKPLHYIYRQEKLGEELFWDTMCDLQYKLMECKQVFNVWGTFVTGWFQRFYLCERFKLGRLQYETAPFPYESYKGILKKDDTVYNCHIPSCGALTPDAILDSLKRAYAFYKPKDGILPVVCDSWLLYPPHKDVFPTGSNLSKFAALFDVIDSAASENNHDFWRIFGCNYSPDLKALPNDTKLRRNFIDYLSQGNHMGCGFGVLLFDGEKIMTD